MHFSFYVVSAAVAVSGVFFGDAPRSDSMLSSAARAPWATVAPRAGQKAPVNETARVLADFKARVDKYVALRKQAAKDGPPLKQTEDPAKINAAQAALAEHIRALRPDAKPGDIFTAEVRPVFRRLLAPELKGAEGRDAKAVLKDDAPSAVPLKVNAKYPEKQPLPTVPASILTSLPMLPKEVEYRLVKKDLLLFDPEAEIIVDYIANAIR